MAEEARLTLQGIPLVVRNKQLVDFSREISKMVAEARNNFAKSLVRIVNFVDKTFNIRGLELFVSTCRPSQPNPQDSAENLGMPVQFWNQTDSQI